VPRYRLLYHPHVTARDIPRLELSVRRRIKAAIEHKLQDHPEAHAKPLAHTTQRLWWLRVGDWRVAFALRSDEVWILRIGHRRDVYAQLAYRRPPDDTSVSEQLPPRIAFE
jgi:mRNA-degrading endonuclease RelE of RelBE toxin-antitoxin system